MRSRLSETETDCRECAGVGSGTTTCHVAHRWPGVSRLIYHLFISHYGLRISRRHRTRLLRSRRSSALQQAVGCHQPSPGKSASLTHAPPLWAVGTRGAAGLAARQGASGAAAPSARAGRAPAKGTAERQPRRLHAGTHRPRQCWRTRRRASGRGRAAMLWTSDRRCASLCAGTSFAARCSSRARRAGRAARRGAACSRGGIGRTWAARTERRTAGAGGSSSERGAQAESARPAAAAAASHHPMKCGMRPAAPCVLLLQLCCYARNVLLCC